VRAANVRVATMEGYSGEIRREWRWRRRRIEILRVGKLVYEGLLLSSGGDGEES